MLALRIPRAVSSNTFRRSVSTLQNNPHIYVFPSPSGAPNTSILSLLSTSPPNRHLAIGTTTAIPPTPDSLTENPDFLEVLQSVVQDHATHDPEVIQQAATYASNAGSSLGSGGAFFPNQMQQGRRQRQRGQDRSFGGGGGAGGDGAGGASAQGGVGGAGRGGFVHVSDQRNPPDWGRVAYPEDILGSLEIDGKGEFVGETGRYQRSGTYRIVTREGILGISPYLRQKLVERLKEIEKTL